MRQLGARGQVTGVLYYAITIGEEEGVKSAHVAF